MILQIKGPGKECRATKTRDGLIYIHGNGRWEEGQEKKKNEQYCLHVKIVLKTLSHALGTDTSRN